MLDGAADIFERGGKKAPAVDEDTVRSLHAKIGDRGAGCGQRFFVMKAQAMDRQVRRGMVDKTHPSLSVGAQCRLLSILRSSFY